MNTVESGTIIIAASLTNGDYAMCAAAIGFIGIDFVARRH